MKALTLYQPWATLVAIGAKRIETRSWKTDYRGPLAIHAGLNKKYINMKSKYYLCYQIPFISILTNFSYHNPWSKFIYGVLPIGVILATCELADCKKIDDYDSKYRLTKWSSLANGDGYVWEISDQEKIFGDYSIGRYMWFLANIEILSKPIEARGALGLWEWEAMKDE